MTRITLPKMHRRTFLAGGAAITGAALLAGATRLAAQPARQFALVATTGRLPLVGPPYPDTDVWCYDGRIPGPEIRVRQGERIRVTVQNRLPEETTVHWHGVRVPHAMDGVPHLTQKPIAPGDTFTYEFDCPDAGTFWYHPHQRSFAQVGRGLYGALIVEEPKPVAIDRDVTWVLGDWRLLKDASISADFGNMHDVSHDGRIGNTVTVNGRVAETFQALAGERLRLRLVNSANARIFGLEFQDHRPRVLAIDGQPVEPHVPTDHRVVLAPGMRTELLLDMVGRPGQHYRVLDTFYRGREYRLLDLAYVDKPPVRDLSTAESIKLPSNPLAEPNLEAAARHEVTLAGGMMGGMNSAIMDGQSVDMRTLLRNGLAWAINGVAAMGHRHDPFVVLERNRSCVLQINNDTVWHHPMHLHGHSFRVISRNGRPTRYREWQDTVLLAPRERVEIAFVADNPGDWMFHCHNLEHQAGGMTGVVRVL
jgi:FtsP/CotA-like multicopper oxidase with cupredoxin domain